MIKIFKQWLYSPYPFPKKLINKSLICISVSSFVFLFLFLFKPFGFIELTLKDNLYYSALYALNTFGILILNLIVLPFILKTIYNKWTVLKMIFFVLEIILLTSFLNWNTSSYSSLNRIDSEYTLLFFFETSLAISFIPLLIYLFITERFLNKKHSTIAKNISLNQKNNNIDYQNVYLDSQIKVVLIGENKNEELILFLNDLIYISSEKNYTSVFYLQNKEIKETLLRSSLNKIEKQLEEFSFIVRCHKSYIVNTNKVEEIQGNARNYLLKIPKIAFLIPVSRSFPRELLFTLVKK